MFPSIQHVTIRHQSSRVFGTSISCAAILVLCCHWALKMAQIASSSSTSMKALAKCGQYGSMTMAKKAATIRHLKSGWFQAKLHKNPALASRPSWITSSSDSEALSLHTASKLVTTMGWSDHHADTLNPSPKSDGFNCHPLWRRSCSMLCFSIAILHCTAPFCEWFNRIARKESVLEGFHIVRLVTVAWSQIEVTKIFFPENEHVTLPRHLNLRRCESLNHGLLIINKCMMFKTMKKKNKQHSLIGRHTDHSAAVKRTTDVSTCGIFISMQWWNDRCQNTGRCHHVEAKYTQANYWHL